MGALLVEIRDLVQVLQVKKKLPWKVRGGPPRGIYLLAAILRTALGIGVAVVLGTFGQISGGFGAVIAGMAAPKIIESLRTQTIASAPQPQAHEMIRNQATPAPSRRTASEITEGEAAQDAT
ncbi:hypothetical protein [Streptomyces arenae]|uniref:hypothetical protein n=1 Tax=Streptomyces arenae TaxID=29301 RepID=UPI00265A8BB9|nr:hypothetical protein [Streptomyces arenae]MCG7203974.1 hypothetical protein [Streptomyces arenae]